MNRIFLREQVDETYIVKKNRQKIGIVGISAGVGTSLIASSLAKYLSKEKANHIAFVEVAGKKEGCAYAYDSLGMDKRFAGRVFYDFYREVKEGRMISELANIDERINWALKIPSNLAKDGESKALEPIEMCSLINNVAANIVICDISVGADVEYIIKEMDIVIFVIDPLPSKLISGYNFFCHMKNCELKGQKIIWLINKYNEGVNKRELNAFIKIKKYITIPMMQQEYLYMAEYNCRIPYAVKAVAEVISQPLEEIRKQLEN